MKIQKLDLNNQVELLGFKSIYEDSFPNVDEREPLDAILSRVGKNTEELYTEIYLLTNTEDELIGGIVFDIYNDNSGQCDAEIIYLAVDSKFRNSGYGTVLLKQAVEKLKSDLTIRHIFLEAERPDEFIPQTMQRLRFWRRNGAKRIPIEYKQPPLSADTDWIEGGLDLYVLEEETISDDDLDDFITKFCNGLGAAKYEIKLKTIEISEGYEK